MTVSSFMAKLATFLLFSVLSTAATAAAFSGSSDNKEIASNIKHTDHRVIVKYSDHAKEENSLDKYVEMLQGLTGVVKAQPLTRLSMAVVSLESSDDSEKLLERLRKEDDVELAVMDTFVSAFDFLPPKEPLEDIVAEAKSQAEAAAASASAALRVLRGQDHLPAQCSAHPACRMRGLVGDCCPAMDGTMLSCCSASGPDFVSFRTAHDTYLAANANGQVVQRSGSLQEDGKWEIMANDDGTLSLRSHFGKYLSSDDHFVLAANSDMRSEQTGWEMSRNEDNSLSLSSRFRRYICAEPTGHVAADRVNKSAWESFSLEEVESPAQRFAPDRAMEDLWGMHHWAGNDIDAPEAWRIWNGEIGAGITVAVIDTGIDYTHEDLREQMWVNPGEIPGNGIDDDNNGWVDDVHGADFVNQDGDPMDDQMHGTHCSGTIAGVGGNGIGVAGVSWRGVRLMALKFLDAGGSGRTSDSIFAIDYAVAHGAKIASNSWGGGGSNPGLAVAIAKAERAGMLFPAAAGNEGQNNDEVPSYPANYESDNIISVASMTWLGEMSSFSCYGKTTVHVAAPGSSIYSTTPGNNYKHLSGTSMATPHVSGLAALVWMYRPQLTMSQVRDVIIGSVKKMDALTETTISGGMINAKNALEAAWAFEPPRPPANRPLGLAFEDTDSTINQYSGTIVVTAAEDESDIEYYQVYFVSGAGFQLDTLGEQIPATGEETYTVELNGSFVPSRYARYLAVVPGNSQGELPAMLSDASVPRIEIVDFGLPEEGARSLTWSGDQDSRAGFVEGTLSIQRARSESTITSYNLYWQQADGTLGSKIAALTAYGFQEPSCSGASCDLLEMGRTTDGTYTFARLNYSDSEKAVIAASGPGWVKVTMLNTEDSYDTLTVGKEVLSGNLSETLPMIFELGQEAIDITWESDESIQQWGWSFELSQTGDSFDFKVNSTALLGTGFALIPEWKGHEEVGEAIYVDITDATPEASSSSVTATNPRGRHLEGTIATSPIIKQSDIRPPTASKQVAAALKKDESEAPWLVSKQSGASGERFGDLWKEATVEPSAMAAALGLVRSTITLPKLMGSATPASTTPVRRAVEASLGPVLRDIAGDIYFRSVRVGANSDGDMQVTFEVETLKLEPLVLDYVEAHLILLAGNTQAGKSFQTSLRSALKKEHLAISGENWAAEVGAPQRMSARMLLSRFQRTAVAQSMAAPASTAAGQAPEGPLRRLRGVVTPATGSNAAPILE